MKTSVDTNVFAALWKADDALNSMAKRGLDRALDVGELVISAPVYAELVAAPGRSEAIVDAFFRETGVSVDWLIDERIWREAGRAYQLYANARRRRREPGRRRVLADFIIGAHAVVRGARLLTFDSRIYRSAFPSLDVISI
jgi:predicted nucleic acid-binding protein